MEEFHPLELRNDAPPVAEEASAGENNIEGSRFRSSQILIFIQMIIYGGILIWFLADFLPLGLM